ncbi:ATP-binding protein [Candidatus Woesearchaeota archaeon]|nr:ATP-binding protein [Candidatus Woesearchaeota archaeon]
MAKNPYEFESIIRKTSLVNRDEELKEAIYYSKASCVFFLEGPIGVGKTYFAHKLIEELRKQTRIIFVDAKNHNKSKDIEKTILESNKFFSKMTHKKPRRALLIIDNISSLSKKNQQRIKYYFDQDYLGSVMLIGESYEETKLIESLRHRTGSRTISLTPHGEQTVYEVYKQVSNGAQLSQYEITRMYEDNERNLKKLIGELGFLHSQKTSEHQAYLDYSREFVHVNHTQKKVDYCLRCNSKLENIKENYRCPRCDTYCMACGKIVGVEDDQCPACLAIFK